MVGWVVCLMKEGLSFTQFLARFEPTNQISTTKQQQWLGGWHVWQHKKKVVRFAHYFLVRFEPTTSCQNNKQTNNNNNKRWALKLEAWRTLRAGWLACLCNKCDFSTTKALPLLVIDCCLWRGGGVVVVVVVGCSRRTSYSGQIWISKNGPNHPSIHQSINPHAHPICQKK